MSQIEFFSKCDKFYFLADAVLISTRVTSSFSPFRPLRFLVQFPSILRFLSYIAFSFLWTWPTPDIPTHSSITYLSLSLSSPHLPWSNASWLSWQRFITSLSSNNQEVKEVSVTSGFWQIRKWAKNRFNEMTTGPSDQMITSCTPYPLETPTTLLYPSLLSYKVTSESGAALR